MNTKDITDVMFEGIDESDYPDYCDAFISKASYKGEKLTNMQLDFLNENRDLTYELLQDYLINYIWGRDYGL